MSTQAYAAKKALFDRFKTHAVTGQPLDGVQVEYAWPGEPELKCVYGGGIRFNLEDAVAEPGLMLTETDALSVYVRVVARPRVPVEETDLEAARIGADLAGILRTDPHLAGGFVWLGISSGQGDYEQTDDETISVLALQMRVTSVHGYGG